MEHSTNRTLARDGTIIGLLYGKAHPGNGREGMWGTPELQLERAGNRIALGGAGYWSRSNLCNLLSEQVVSVEPRSNVDREKDEICGSTLEHRCLHTDCASALEQVCGSFSGCSICPISVSIFDAASNGIEIFGRLEGSPTPSLNFGYFKRQIQGVRDRDEIHNR